MHINKPQHKIDLSIVKYAARICILLLIFNLSSNVFSQGSNNFAWLKSMGGKSSDIGYDICSDNNGNIYVTGYFQSNAVFGDFELISNGDTDIFLSKLDKYGNLIWIKQFGSNFRKNLVATEFGNSVVCDSVGNIYLSGIFSLEADFGNTTLKSNGGDDIFLIKLNPSGKVIWAFNYGSKDHDRVFDLKLDSDNNILMSGMFGSTPSNRSLNITSKNSCSFLSSIDNIGNISIIRSVYGSGFVEANCINIDVNNNIYWAVNFNNEIIIDNKNFKSNGNSDIIIEKISDDYKSLWIKHFGGKGCDRVNSIVASGSEILFVGSFENEIQVDNLSVKSYGNSDVLLGSLNNKSSKVEWLNRFGGAFNDVGRAIAINNTNELIVIGDFQGIVYCELDTLVSNGYCDIAVFNYSKNHKLNWINTFGNDNSDFVNSFVIDNETAFFTGSFRGELESNDVYLKSKGSSDILFGSTVLKDYKNLISFILYLQPK